MKKALGKGLSALLPRIPAEDGPQKGEKIVDIPLAQITANPEQPRKFFDEEKLRELADSIASFGVLQPIIVRKGDGELYEIVAGERRFRAAALAGKGEIPCIVRDFAPDDVLELSLIENIQREDLNIIEEAETYHALQQRFDYTQEQLAARLGKSRPHIANTLRLLSLDGLCRAMLREGRLSAGHGRALLALPDADAQRALAQRIFQETLSVRQTEDLARAFGKPAGKKFRFALGGPRPAARTILRAIEDRLRQRLATKVSVKAAQANGQIVIEYYGEEDLTRIVDLLLPDERF
ncbi:MAG: ParB/RepB/Spo0J family partition protein [Clostridiales bacterium]|nr:ParB/RepB/Spo0J family partition protein [Clostridiales bacterium]